MNSHDDLMAPPAAKRVAPPEVPPVEMEDIRIEVLHWGREEGLGQNGGHLRVYDADSGALRNTIKVYEIEYDEKMEWDVQDRFIEELWKDEDDQLHVIDEDGNEFRVDPHNGKVEQIA